MLFKYSSDKETQLDMYAKDEESAEGLDHPLLEDEREESRQRRPSSGRFRGPVLQILCLILFSSLSFFLGTKVSHERADERACLDTSWDKVRDAVQFEDVHFKAHSQIFVEPDSPYMGMPSPELDEHWHALTRLRNFGVDYNTLQKMNRTRGAIKLASGRYRVGMEIFHHLHCLNYMRMFGDKEYYVEHDVEMSLETPEQSRKHRDHCMESLRQRLVCNPDLNLLTYHWRSEQETPWLNLASPHRCVNWDAFNSWVGENIEHITLDAVYKAADAEVWA